MFNRMEFVPDMSDKDMDYDSESGMDSSSHSTEDGSNLGVLMYYQSHAMVMLGEWDSSDDESIFGDVNDSQILWGF